MRSIPIVLLTALLGACGSSATDTARTRYNFAVVDGRNQTTAAGDATLPNRITSQLTRDPQGKFSVLDFLLPTKAYAQGLTLTGEPVAGAIVCGREAKAGEPQVVPLCAFTLADGKAANTVVPGTKAGTYNIVFTAQVPATEPVKDSTSVIVAPDVPWEVVLLDAPNGRTLAVGATLDLRPLIVFVRDQYGNDVDWSKLTPGVALRAVGSVPAAPDVDSWTIAWNQQWSGQRVYVYVWFGNARTYFPLDFK